MKPYFDTSVLIKSYVMEPRSEEAIENINQAGTGFPISHITTLEMTNALQLKVFRNEISQQVASRYLRAFEYDIESGYMYYPPHDIGSIFLRAQKLSLDHSITLGSRSLDILHVASALEFGCDTLITFDQKQERLAKEAGLKTH
jgi:predicted nucleic acid-binding protein